MTVRFNAGSAQYINFGDGTSMEGHLLSSLFIRYIKKSTPALDYQVFFMLGKNGGTFTDEAELVYLSQLYPNEYIFARYWSTSIGVWQTTNAVITNNVEHTFCVTYDGNSSSNSPVMYHDGVSKSVSTLGAPSGTISLSNADYSLIGGSNNSPDAEIIQFLFYNRILSSSEVLDLHSSKLAISNYNGLVFSPNLYGAAGLQIFDGATLSSSNKIAEHLSGVLGTPSGSPIGVADIILTHQP